MKKIPIILIYSRILIAILVLFAGLGRMENYKEWISFLMIAGLITDIFDGIIARKLNISTEKLRILDSNVDQVFWLTVIATIFYLNSDFILKNILWVFFIVALEALAYVISYQKFKRTIATHSILAKFWTISLVVFLVSLTLNSTSHWPFLICIVLGIISRIEIILIILKLKTWTTDVPSILSVSKINQGIAIKKNKLFNS